MGGNGYNDDTYARIVEETGDQYLEPGTGLTGKRWETKSKLKLKAML